MLLLLVFTSALGIASGVSSGDLRGGALVDLQGKAVTSLARDGAKVVVLVFAATDCPISKRYIPEIARIEQETKAKGVAFWWVFPNPEDTAAVVRQHELDYSIRTATLIDGHQDLVRMAHVAVTPEAAVFTVYDGALTEVYHGRIDDRYIAFGRERPQASHHELEEAIEAVLSGKAVAPAAGGPVGCSIVPLSMEPKAR